MHKDPYYYFFIVPIALLILQVVLWFTYRAIKQWLLNKLDKLSSLISQYEQRPSWRRTSLREAALQAEANRKQRIVDNHSKLLRQGERSSKSD